MKAPVAERILTSVTGGERLIVGRWLWLCGWYITLLALLDYVVDTPRITWYNF